MEIEPSPGSCSTASKRLPLRPPGRHGAGSPASGTPAENSIPTPPPHSFPSFHTSAAPGDTVADGCWGYRSTDPIAVSAYGQLFRGQRDIEKERRLEETWMLSPYLSKKEAHRRDVRLAVGRKRICHVYRELPTS